MITDNEHIHIFQNQVSGHHSIFKNDLNNYLLKPLNQNEFEFYEMIKKSQSTLQKYLPKFYGSFDIECENELLLQKIPTWMKKLNKNQIDCHQFLIIEDLTQNKMKPCILDLKMGFRPYNEQKLERQKQKLEQSTSRYALIQDNSSLGCRINGFSLNNNDQQIFYDKYWCQKLDEQQFQEYVQNFLSVGSKLKTNLTTQLIKLLKDLELILENETSYIFNSSSLLIVYDGDIDDENYLDDQIFQQKAVVKLIDFGKVQLSQENKNDQQLIQGCINFRYFLEELLRLQDKQ